MPIVLASASPRRAELLRAAGIEFEVMPAHIDETAHAAESPEAYVRRVADSKARAIAGRVNDRIILAADTTVVIDDQMLAKPEDDEDAKRMLRMLSGRTHEVLTAVAVCRGPEGSAPLRTGRLIEIERTQVEFAPLTEFEIDWYVATGEPRDKAGAYAIQGYASRFITRIDGSYSNVVGLPMALVYDILKGLTTL
ncbi:MAG TPA: Maf family protein [Vicinamibacterales bacterium]|jgi:septum formation protein|nr:Maf family protein [Vicinamibacterales bacterium]